MVAFNIQVVGPFIDTKHLLFGDYAPTVMVSETAGSFINVVLLSLTSLITYIQEQYVMTPLKAISGSEKIASSVTAEPGCFDGPSCK